MLLFVIPILLMSSGANSQGSYFVPKQSAASESQIRFAIESKLNETSQGATGREYAYDTFKTLDEAIVGYLDDPDTKLPELERAKAEQRLIGQQKQTYNQIFNNRPIFLNPFAYSDKNLYNTDVNVQVVHPNEYKYKGVELEKLNQYKYKGVELEHLNDPFRVKVHKLQSVKSSPLNLAHYTNPLVQEQEFNPNPQYTFSYGVHDKLTGDSKSAHESREGGIVRGFYTFRDADGKQRTVQYTADDKLGFRALVRRTPGNGQ